MKTQSNINGVKNNNWETPKYLLDYIKKEFFKGEEYFDPCPYNPEYSIDGLTLDWGKYTFVNPPYTPKEKSAFVNKCYEESLKGKIVVLLIPSATETQIFHRIIYPNAKVYLIEKRVCFKGYDTYGKYVTNKTGQSGSALCIFDNSGEYFIKPLSIKNDNK